jgi:hypothetical protein
MNAGFGALDGRCHGMHHEMQVSGVHEIDLNPETQI